MMHSVVLFLNFFSEHPIVTDLNSNLKQDSQWTRNETLRRVRTTTAALEKK
jgi:hypothetical protein